MKKQSFFRLLTVKRMTSLKCPSMILFGLFFMISNSLLGQRNEPKPQEEPIQWEFHYKRLTKDTIVLVLDATIAEGWYLSAQDALAITSDSQNLKTFDISLRIFDKEDDNVEYIGPMKASHMPKVFTNAGLDKKLNMNYYQEKVRFVQLAYISNIRKDTYIQAYLYYNALRQYKDRLYRPYKEGLRDNFRLKLSRYNYPVLYAGLKAKPMFAEKWQPKTEK